jgi:hypothetical protein
MTAAVPNLDIQVSDVLVIINFLKAYTKHLGVQNPRR